MGLLEFCNLSVFTRRTSGLLPLTPCEIPRHVLTFEGIEMCPEGVLQALDGGVGVGVGVEVEVDRERVSTER